MHTPDGARLVIDADAIDAVKPIASQHHDHLKTGTHSALYLRSHSSFGITETTDEVLRAIKSCR